MTETSDAELLSAWVTQRREPAFHALVVRYAGLVHMASKRACGDDTLAADASQLAFIQLAQKAKSLLGHPSLAGWLHVTAVMKTRELLGKNQRESRKHQLFHSTMEPESSTPHDGVWQEIQPHLNDALDSLSKNDREAILLRFYRSLSVREIAATLGIATDAAQKRLDRATDRLREKLTRRGVTTTASLSATMLAGFSADAQAAVISTSVLSSKSIAAIAASAVSSTGISSIALLIMTQKTTITAVALLLLAGGAAIAVKNPGMFFKNSGAEPRAQTASFPTGENSRSGGRIADREREKQKKESIQLAAQKRYEELLEKYPDMRPTYRNVPDEENGYLQFLLLAERLDEQWLPEDLRLMLKGDSDWDAEKFKSWLAKNQNWFDSILRMAELPNSSTRGIALDRLSISSLQKGKEFAFVLRSAARLEAEGGDMETALRYFSAAVGLGDLLISTEAPSLLGMTMSMLIRYSSRDPFREGILPFFTNQPELLEAWGAAVFRDVDLAAEYARVLKGEWNIGMRHLMLPQLIGEATPDFDADAFIDSYTTETRKFAEGVSQQGPDRFDLSQINAWNPTLLGDLLNAELLGESFSEIQRFTRELALQHTRQAMHSAAFAIQIGGKPKPDPVSGKEFRWNPENRVLTAPEGVNGIDEIKIP